MNNFDECYDIIPDSLSTIFIANLLKVHRKTVTKWIKDGKLKSSMVANEHVITKQELSRFITERHYKK